MRKAARHETAWTRKPPSERTQGDQGRRRCRPDPDRATPFLAVEGCRDDRERPRDEERAGRALEEAGEDQDLHRRGCPADRGCDPEADQAQPEDAAPAHAVGECPGQDQESGERRPGSRWRRRSGPRAVRRADAGRSRPIVSSATLTIVPSRKTIPEPRTTASRTGPRRTFTVSGPGALVRFGARGGSRHFGASVRTWAIARAIQPSRAAGSATIEAGRLT